MIDPDADCELLAVTTASFGSKLAAGMILLQDI